MATPKNIVLSGVPISPGLAQGRAFVFRDIMERVAGSGTIQPDEVGRECERIERAIGDVLRDLNSAAEHVEREVDAVMANIFRAHGEMLRDVTFTDEIRAEIRKDLVNVEHALRRVFGRWEGRFRSMQSETQRRRGDDIADLGRRLLRSLAGIQGHSLAAMPKGSMLVARRLLPSDTTFFPERSVAGIAVEEGGPGSHCALLTRQMGIPGVAQVAGLLDRVGEGDVLLLDGSGGRVTIDPDEEAGVRFSILVKNYLSGGARAGERAHEPAVTRDGVAVPVMVNIGNRRDAEVGMANGADGVGLFRTEVLFLSRERLPTEGEVEEEIRDALDPFKGKPVSVRLLDIGGDKALPYLPFPSEPNPFLGRRGVRVLLDFPELLGLQLRALVRVARDHDLQIIVPMITVAEEMGKVRAALESAAAGVGARVLPQLGAMIETPAAALCAAEVAAVSDFLNIGTNDLTQYTMAAGRENALVGRYFQDDHPAIMRLLRLVGGAAGGVPVGICGDLASRCDLVPGILASGIGMLSVPPTLVPRVKEAVRDSRTGGRGGDSQRVA